MRSVRFLLAALSAGLCLSAQAVTLHDLFHPRGMLGDPFQTMTLPYHYTNNGSSTASGDYLCMMYVQWDFYGNGDSSCSNQANIIETFCSYENGSGEVTAGTNCTPTGGPLATGSQFGTSSGSGSGTATLNSNVLVNISGDLGVSLSSAACVAITFDGASIASSDCSGIPTGVGAAEVTQQMLCDSNTPSTQCGFDGFAATEIDFDMNPPE